MEPKWSRRAPRGPQVRFQGATRPPRKRPLGVFGPPKTTIEKKIGSLLRPAGARCTFYLRKNAFGRKCTLGSKGAFGEAFGALGRPLGCRKRFRRSPGASSFGPSGAKSPPECRFKNVKTASGSSRAALGGADVRLTYVRTHSAKKRKKWKKKQLMRHVVARSVSQAPENAILGARRPPEGRFKILRRETGSPKSRRCTYSSG